MDQLPSRRRSKQVQISKGPRRLTAKKNEDQQSLSGRQEIWRMKAPFTSTIHYQPV